MHHVENKNNVLQHIHQKWRDYGNGIITRNVVLSYMHKHLSQSECDMYKLKHKDAIKKIENKAHHYQYMQHVNKKRFTICLTQDIPFAHADIYRTQFLHTLSNNHEKRIYTPYYDADNIGFSSFIRNYDFEPISYMYPFEPAVFNANDFREIVKPETKTILSFRRRKFAWLPEYIIFGHPNYTFEDYAVFFQKQAYRKYKDKRPVSDFMDYMEYNIHIEKSTESIIINTSKNGILTPIWTKSLTLKNIDECALYFQKLTTNIN